LVKRVSELNLAPGLSATIVDKGMKAGLDGKIINKYTLYNPRVWKYVPLNYVYVDVGAYVGQTVNQTIKEHPYYGCVLALEPFSINFSKLRNNVKLDRNIILVNKGCWDERKITPIYMSDKYSGISVIRQPHHKGILEYVELDTLDSILEDYNIPEPDMVKIDTENSEPYVLKGFTKYKEGTQLHVETHNSNHEKVLDVILDMGFTILESGTFRRQGTILAIYGDING